MLQGNHPALNKCLGPSAMAAIGQGLLGHPTCTRLCTSSRWHSSNPYHLSTANKNFAVSQCGSGFISPVRSHSYAQQTRSTITQSTSHLMTTYFGRGPEAGKMADLINSCRLFAYTSLAAAARGSVQNSSTITVGCTAFLNSSK